MNDAPSHSEECFEPVMEAQMNGAGQFVLRVDTRGPTRSSHELVLVEEN